MKKANAKEYLQYAIILVRKGKRENICARLCKRNMKEKAESTEISYLRGALGKGVERIGKGETIL